MTGRHRFLFTYLVAVPLAVLLLGGATLGWATSRDVEPYGLRFGSPADGLPDRAGPDADADGAAGADGAADSDGGPDGAASAGAPDPTWQSGTGTPYPEDPGPADADVRTPGPDAGASGPPGTDLPDADLPDADLPGVTVPDAGLPDAGLPAAGLPGVGLSASRPGDGVRTTGQDGGCRTAADFVPTCGVLWGVAPASTGRRPLRDFEERTGRHQDIYRADHRGTGALFPTGDEIDIARESGRRRALLLTWKPTGTSWAKIAKGDRTVDRYLDRLAAHLRKKYRDDFFFAVHPAAEHDVRAARGSGYTAADYAAMYRHVVRRLRAHGADNLVTVLVHAADPPRVDRTAFHRMYPGDDMVDWIGFDAEARDAESRRHDLAGLLGRQAAGYAWASARHPDKPLMISGWSVWSSGRDTKLRAAAYREIGRDIGRFPKIKAMVYVDTSKRHGGLHSRVDATPAVLREYRRLGALPAFQVDLERSRP